MNDPRLQRSPPLIRTLKWLGLWSGFFGILYLHYHGMSPEYFSERKRSTETVHPDDCQDIVGYRQELLESIPKYHD
ncbi:hypothetical protein DERP_012755 [Dermatophagoides pteronyssinus]|uniref:Uncharacterized protein LOC113794885 n=2 Tax=Dermatophagoides pteronyssinus TaxID=6956 RepID=A0A6P6Y745_DERPT|nr:uncharacterized protein LOC113794885 [Dermatophagoides pteronyssinus]KAH9424771.1 hypothetical protein DERP_012755 [Dermatophagoides pteronyssinus]